MSHKGVGAYIPPISEFLLESSETIKSASNRTNKAGKTSIKQPGNKGKQAAIKTKGKQSTGNKGKYYERKSLDEDFLLPGGTAEQEIKVKEAYKAMKQEEYRQRKIAAEKQEKHKLIMKRLQQTNKF